jgi:predicted ATPase with chaperone activity
MLEKERARLAVRPFRSPHHTISRSLVSLTYPSRVMLVAVMNPCPCGYLSDPVHPCSCTPIAIHRYRSRISGPLLDRIDIHIEVPAVKYRELADRGEAESSAAIAARLVQLCRAPVPIFTFLYNRKRDLRLYSLSIQGRERWE